MNISKRLDTIAGMVEPCGVLADIGCDHGYVSMAALRNGTAKHVIAADVAEGPLDTARKNAVLEGLEHDMEFVISDGFKELHGLSDEPECAVIAGMGGILISSILRNGELGEFGRLRQLVLGPHSDIDLVRRYIVCESKFDIVREKVVCDEGKYYFLIDARLKSINSRDSRGLAAGGSDTQYSVSGRVLQGTESESYVQQLKADGHTRDEGSLCHSQYREYEYFYGRCIDKGSLDTYADFLKHRRHNLARAFENASLHGGERGLEKAAGLKTQIEYIDAAFKAHDIK